MATSKTKRKAASPRPVQHPKRAAPERRGPSRLFWLAAASPLILAAAIFAIWFPSRGNESAPNAPVAQEAAASLPNTPDYHSLLIERATCPECLEIDWPQIRSFNLSGQEATATAVRALSNGDGSEVQLIGDAVMVREAAADKSDAEQPRLEVRGEFLHAFLDAERVLSHLPVTLQRGRDRLSADAFEYSSLDRVLEMRGRVKIDLLAPGRTTQTRRATP